MLDEPTSFSFESLQTVVKKSLLSGIDLSPREVSFLQMYDWSLLPKVLWGESDDDKNMIKVEIQGLIQKYREAEKINFNSHLCYDYPDFLLPTLIGNSILLIINFEK